jgi:hypothetical protein
MSCSFLKYILLFSISSNKIPNVQTIELYEKLFIFIKTYGAWYILFVRDKFDLNYKFISIFS